MKNLILLFLIISNSLTFAGNGDGTLPPLRALGIVIETEGHFECKVFPIETKGLKVLEKDLQFEKLQQSLKLIPGKKGMELELKTHLSAAEKLKNILENRDEVLTILLPDQKIREVLLFTNSKESLQQFLANNGC